MDMIQRFFLKFFQKVCKQKDLKTALVCAASSVQELLSTWSETEKGISAMNKQIGNWCFC